MRVALLTDGIYPYVMGGMQRHSFYLAKYFAISKVHVDLYHFNQSKRDIEKLECFTEDEKKNIRHFVLQFPALGNFPGHYIKESYEYSCRIYNVFKKQPPVDFIIAKGFAGWKLIEEKQKGLRCAPIGVNFHGYEMFQKAPSLRSKAAHILLRKPVLYNVKNADFVFSYGGKITEIIQGLGIESKKIFELPAAIEGEWIAADLKAIDATRKFVFVGRYERRKGVEELNAALKKMIKELNLEFHFIGNIPTEKRLISDKVFYHGEVSDNQKLKNLLSGFDVLVCPSYAEGMPNVILEAMARGLAVIATEVGAVQNMVSEENGWLLSSLSTDVLLKAMRSALEIPVEELKQMKVRSIEKVKAQFIWNENINRMIQLIQKCINK